MKSYKQPLKIPAEKIYLQKSQMRSFTKMNISLGWEQLFSRINVDDRRD